MGHKSIAKNRKRKLDFLIKRDGKKCRYCNHPLEREEMTFDHVKPVARGGKNLLWNLVIACHQCNATKGDKPLKEFVLGARNSKYATKFLNNIRSQHKSLKYE